MITNDEQMKKKYQCDSISGFLCVHLDKAKSKHKNIYQTDDTKSVTFSHLLSNEGFGTRHVLH